MNFGKLSILMLMDIFVNEFRFINNKIIIWKKKIWHGLINLIEALTYHSSCLFNLKLGRSLFLWKSTAWFCFHISFFFFLRNSYIIHGCKISQWSRTNNYLIYKILKFDICSYFKCLYKIWVYESSSNWHLINMKFGMWL